MPAVTVDPIANTIRYGGLTYGIIRMSFNLAVVGNSAAAPTFPATATAGTYTVNLAVTDNLGTVYPVNYNQQNIVHVFGGTFQNDSFDFEVFIPYNAARNLLSLRPTLTNSLTGGDNNLTVTASVIEVTMEF